MHTRRIHQNNLAVGSSDYAEYFEASSLRLVRNGRDLFAREPVEQSRLAGVRSTDKGDMAGAMDCFGIIRLVL
jgi:hypothetical protein